MKCPNCGQEMRPGFLFSTKDGALSFADEVPSWLRNAKHAEGFVKVTEARPNHRASIDAQCCEACRTIVINY